MPQVLEDDLIETLATLSEIPFQGSDSGKALKEIAKLGKSALKSYACTLTFVDLNKRTLRQVACAGFDSDFEQYMDRDIPLGSSGDDLPLKFEQMSKGEVLEKYGLEHDGQGIANPKIAERHQLHAALCYPLHLHDKLIGYFNHFVSPARKGLFGSQRFTDQEKRLIRIFAHHAESAIERIHLLQLMGSRWDSLDPADEGAAIGSGTELEETLDTIVRDCTRALRADACFLRLWNKATDTLELNATARSENGSSKSSGSWLPRCRLLRAMSPATRLDSGPIWQASASPARRSYAAGEPLCFLSAPCRVRRRLLFPVR